MIAKVTAIGILITVFLGSMFLYWSRGISDPLPIYLCAGFGISFQVFTWFAASRLGNFGKGLLITIVGTLLVSYIPYFKYPMFVLAAILSLFFFKSFLEDIFKKWTDLFLILVFSILYTVIIFAITSENYNDPFQFEKLREFAPNPDILFHAAVATMIKNYGHISTGLHGLPRLHYHVFSHFLYAGLSRLLGIEVYDVYGDATCLIFSPMLIAGLLNLLSSYSFKKKYNFLLINVVVLGGPISQTFNWSGDSFFLSESYLCGLILLTGGLFLLASMIRDDKWDKNCFYWLLAYIPLICVSKISVGFIFCMSALIAIFFKKNLTLKQKLVNMGCASFVGIVGYLLSRTDPIPNLEVKFKWKYYQLATRDPSLLHFTITMFPYFYALLPMFYLLKREDRLDNEKKTWLFIISAASLVGFLALNMTIDSSSYYFSNVHAFLALPILALIFSEFPISFKLIREKQLRNFYVVFLLGFLSSSSVYFFLKLLPEQLSQSREIKAHVVTDLQFRDQNFSLLQKIHDDPDSMLMVYIPKTEKNFWEMSDGKWSPWRTYTCITMPFYVPLISGKPAIFGLPDPARHCYTFFKGYESYKTEEYAGSGVKNHSKEELCQVVLQKGFHGYYKISQGVAEKNLCEKNL